jgi:hypothetical protein
MHGVLLRTFWPVLGSGLVSSVQLSKDADRESYTRRYQSQAAANKIACRKVRKS